MAGSIAEEYSIRQRPSALGVFFDAGLHFVHADTVALGNSAGKTAKSPLPSLDCCKMEAGFATAETEPTARIILFATLFVGK